MHLQTCKWTKKSWKGKNSPLRNVHLLSPAEQFVSNAYTSQNVPIGKIDREILLVCPHFLPKGKQWCVFVAQRALNIITKRKPTLVPRSDEFPIRYMMQNIVRKLCSTLFHRNPEKAAFTTKYIQSQYTVLYIWLFTVPATLYIVINSILTYFMNECLVFIQITI